LWTIGLERLHKIWLRNLTARKAYLRCQMPTGGCMFCMWLRRIGKRSWLYFYFYFVVVLLQRCLWRSIGVSKTHKSWCGFSLG